MASGFTTTTSLAEIIPEITLGVDYIFQNKAIGRSLVTYKDVSNVPGKAIEFPIYTEVSASTGAGETATPDSHQMDLSAATLTIAKRVVYVGLGDLAKKSMADSPATIGEAMGLAMVKAIDVSIFNVISTTNYATSAGSTDQSMSITYALNALNQLELNEVDSPIHCVLHPHQYKSIRSGLTPVANDDGVAVAAASQMTQEAFVGRMLGMNWFVTSRVSSRTVDATANTYSGLVFNPRGIGYAFSWLNEAGVESIRSDESLTKLLLAWADSAGVIYASGVCTLYSTSS